MTKRSAKLEARFADVHREHAGHAADEIDGVSAPETA
jgi:hypothetical protein